SVVHAPQQPPVQHQKGKFKKIGGARPQAAQLGPVGMWSKAGQPVGNPCGQARGQAQPVHQLVQQGCPRAERSEPAGARRASSTYPRAGGCKGANGPLTSRLCASKV
ncbi:hypothetical protein D4655_22255, partial [Shigella flexneri]|nr:hypothetical protein [Shigella flexneri]